MDSVKGGEAGHEDVSNSTGSYPGAGGADLSELLKYRLLRLLNPH